MSDAPVFRLIYRSHVRIPAAQRKAELGAIFSAARSNNRKAGVTGALLATEEYFVQALEGEEGAVQALYELIARDVRHERVTVVERGTASSRVFSRWSMAQIGADGAADIPLIMNRDRGGAVAAAGRPTTAEQDAVLDFMRRSALEATSTP